MSKRLLRIRFLIVLLLLLRAVPARADVAPPEPPYGTNPVPGAETTQVRMESERW
jgi:hypothetical protein